MDAEVLGNAYFAGMILGFFCGAMAIAGMWVLIPGMRNDIIFPDDEVHERVRKLRQHEDEHERAHHR